MKLLLWKMCFLALLSSLGCAALAQPVTQAEPPRRFTIAYVNDIHAQLEPHPELFWSGDNEEYVRGAGGLARLATAVNGLRKDRPGEVVFIDGGDTIQGSGPAFWTEGRVVVEPMNALGLDLAIPGNWAVTYGSEALMQRAQEFSYPLIAANVLASATKTPVFRQSVVKEINGIKVGFVGFTDADVPRRQPPFMSRGLEFLSSDVLQPLVDRLRAEEKVEVVVLITHIGLNKAVRLAETLQGVDIILSADTHERTYQPIRRGQTWVVEAGAFASFLGVLDVSVASGKVVEKNWQLWELRPERFPEDSTMKAVVDKALAPHRARQGQVLGHTDRWLARYDVLNSSIDQVISEAIREKTGTDVALVNGYRFAAPVAPGAITEGDLWNWLPLQLPVKTGKASGSKLLEYWERELENVFSPDVERQFGGRLPRPSGMSLVFDPKRSVGERLLSLQVGGAPIDPNRAYSIASGSYLGAPENQVHRVSECYHTELWDVDMHQAVREYLQRQALPQTAPDPAVTIPSGVRVMRSQTVF